MGAAAGEGNVPTMVRTALPVGALGVDIGATGVGAALVFAVLAAIGTAVDVVAGDVADAFARAAPFAPDSVAVRTPSAQLAEWVRPLT